jgi:hypothetical protein
MNQRVGPDISQGKSEFLGFLEVDCRITRRNPFPPPKIDNLSTSHHAQIVDWRGRRLVRQKFTDLHPASQRLAWIVCANPNRGAHMLLSRFNIFTSLLQMIRQKRGTFLGVILEESFDCLRHF